MPTLLFSSRLHSLLAALVVVQTVPLAAQDSPGVSKKNLIVYQEPGRYAGWPANHGIWIWGNEILMGFELGEFQASDRRIHTINYQRPAEHVLVRSLDGGETWKLEKPASLAPPAGTKVAGVPTAEGGKAPVDCPGGIDFRRPGFAITFRMEDIHIGPSRFYYTTDKGKSWQGPFRVPDFGHRGIAARTDYLVQGKHELTAWLTAAKSNGREGRIIVVRTSDGGKTWKQVALMGDEPTGNDYAIMPSTVRLGNGSLLTAVRYQRWIDLFQSADNGATWTGAGRPAPLTGGNPPSMIRLKDGRLALTYGYRLPPFGIRARISADEGKSWGDEIVLRADGGSRDLGYPRTVQRRDGKLVTAYYFNDANDKERYIGATIWEAPRR
ncbi:MAG: exo-alpha-sialidase [Acidobacteria bacterium]|nr:exo-alpha-sialidase [Acidobacteriota bacterium]